LLKRGDDLSGVDSFEEPADKRPVGFYEAQITVRVRLVMSAADPKAKFAIRDRNDPAPIFSKRFFGLKSFSS
jgi:hypothetical protein